MIAEVRREIDFLVRAAFCGKKKYSKLLETASASEIKAIQKCILLAQKIKYLPKKLKELSKKLYALSLKNINLREQYYAALSRIILIIIGYCFEKGLFTACDTA